MNPRKYTVREYYTALVKGSRSVGFLIRNKKKSWISDEFVERIMLSVTEVNGCEICAYGHTQMALKMGLSKEEIMAILSGQKEVILPEEVKAIMFAQHYAETKGIVDPQAHQAILEDYGDEKSTVILAAIQMMMIGNIGGLPISAFIRRVKGHKDKGSSLLFEVGIPLSTIFLIFPALIQGGIESLLKRPLIHYTLVE